MSPMEANKLVQEGKAVLVDVREEPELRETGLAEGALWMPCSKMDEEEPDWKSFKESLPKDRPILLYCRSGNRSGRVAEFLKLDGFDTYNLGGFSDWVAAALPVKKFP
jgi:rhodanese-related sulfurtransferase